MPNPTFPSLYCDDDSERVVRDGRMEDEMGDGSKRVRKLHADKYDFALRFTLDSSDYSTLKTFYDTYGTSSQIDFVWAEDAVTYVVRFGAEAWKTKWLAGGATRVWVHLVGV